MNVATPTKDCLQLIYDLLLPITKARGDKSLTRQEVFLFTPLKLQPLKPYVLILKSEEYFSSSVTSG